MSVVRLPQAHDSVRQGLVSYAIAIARDKGLPAYVGDGHNRWPAGHLLDGVRRHRLALERATAGAKYHAVAAEGVPRRDLAEAIGRGPGIPVGSISAAQAQAHFGWLAMFVLHDMPARSAWTRKALGWHPTGPGLIADLEHLHVSDG